MTECAAATPDGPCGAPAQEGSPYCWWHDPAKEEERREASSRGGRAPRTPVDLTAVFDEGPKSLRTLQAVAAANESVIGGVLSGKVSLERGRVLMNGFRLQAQVLESIEAAKIREELEDLRAAVRRIEGEDRHGRR